MEYFKSPANGKLKHLHIHLPYVPEFPLLEIYRNDRLGNGKLIKRSTPKALHEITIFSTTY